MKLNFTASVAVAAWIAATGLLGGLAWADTVIPVQSVKTPGALGKGYDTRTQDVKGMTCISAQVPVDYVSRDVQGQVGLQRVQSYEQLSQALGFSMSGRARFGAVNTSMAANFLRQSASTEYSETITFATEFSVQDAVLRLEEAPSKLLTPGAREKAGKSLSNVGYRFIKSCGDEVITSIRRGAKFLITAKFSFLTTTARQEFSSKIGLSGSFNKIEASLSELSESTLKSGSVSVIALQIGGRPERLASIFKKEPQNEGVAAMSVLDCSLENIKACTSVIEKAWSYAGESFPDQVSPEGDGKPARYAADLAYVSQRWDSIGIDINPTSVEAALERHRFELLGKFNEAIQVQQRIQELLSPRFRLSSAQRARLKKHAEAARFNLTVIASRSDVCYSGKKSSATDCLRAINGLKDALVEIDENDLRATPYYPCGAGCSVCREHDDQFRVVNQCLRCERRLSDWMTTSTMWTGIGTRHQPNPMDKLPSLTCENMPAGVRLTVSGGGTVDPNGEIDGYQIAMGLFKVDGQGAQTALGSNLRVYSQGKAQNVDVADIITLTEPGPVRILAAPTYCEHSGHADPRCDVAIGSDFTVKVEAMELIRQLGLH